MKLEPGIDKEVVWEAPGTGRSLWPVAVRAGQFIFLSGMLPVDSSTGCIVHGSIDERSLLTGAAAGRITNQVSFLYEHLDQVLRFLGSSKEKILLINGWLADFR